MKKFSLDIKTPIKGIYLSREMIDLMSIIQCKDIQQLRKCVSNCEQLSTITEDMNSWRQEDIDTIKHKMFKEFQKSFISLEEQVTKSQASFVQVLKHIGIDESIIEELFSIYKKSGTRGIKETLARKYGSIILNNYDDKINMKTILYIIKII